MSPSVDECLRGEVLYGDDFDSASIAEWYRDEKEGYASLGAGDRAGYRYEYRELNEFHAFRYLRHLRFPRVLGFGSAYGQELVPILGCVGEITIVEPSTTFEMQDLGGVPVRYVLASAEGILPTGNASFDLVTCLGVLHHIPNVSFVFRELCRALRPGGYLLLREPIVSMGDWRVSRRGLTKRERGIPLGVLEKLVKSSGLRVVRKALCGFPLIPRVYRVLRKDPYNSKIGTRIDAGLCWALSWNANYHPRNLLERIRPTFAFLVLRRPQ